MTKNEFIELVQSNGGYDSKKEAALVVDAFIDSISMVLAQKDSVALVGFGTFSTAEVAEKSGTIPGSNKRYTKAAHTAPKFRFGKSIKDAVANG